MRHAVAWFGFVCILATFGLALPRTLAGLLLFGLAVFVFLPGPKK